MNKTSNFPNVEYFNSTYKNFKQKKREKRSKNIYLITKNPEMNEVFFISLISRDNRPLHIQSLVPVKAEDEIISDRVDSQTGQPHSPDKETVVSPENNESMNEIHQQSGPIDSDIGRNELLKYHFLSNMALDVFVSPFHESSQGSATLLFIQDGINIYGYETNTGLKILIGCSNEIDDSFNELFSKLHLLYLKIVMNPFQNLETGELKINESSLTKKINTTIYEWDKKYNGDINV